MKVGWRTELGCVAKLRDDLWIEVKCQSNPEIAGSPRNIFRYSVLCILSEVEHWMATAAKADGPIKLRIQRIVARQSDCEG